MVLSIFKMLMVVGILVVFTFITATCEQSKLLPELGLNNNPVKEATTTAENRGNSFNFALCSF